MTKTRLSLAAVALLAGGLGLWMIPGPPSPADVAPANPPAAQASVRTFRGHAEADAAQKWLAGLMDSGVKARDCGTLLSNKEESGSLLRLKPEELAEILAARGITPDGSLSDYYYLLFGFYIAETVP